MQKAQETLLALVRCALWGTPCVLDQRPDWRKVLSLARQQTLLGLVAEAVPSIPENMQPSQEETARLRSAVTGIYRTHALLNRKVAEVKNLMEDHGIRAVLLKGQGVASNYPNPLSRQCGDIDIYVGDEKFLEAMDIIEPGKKHDASVYRHMKHFNVNLDSVEIEIHRIAEIIPGRRADEAFQKWTRHQLLESEPRRVMIGDAEVNLPPVDFDALYIMNHAWHHFMTGGIGLRQICDWAMFLHRFHDTIDINALEDNLKTFNLYQAWLMLGGVAVRHLGLPENELPLHTGEYGGKADKVLEMIWSEGNFGYHSDKRTPRPKGHFAGKFHSFKTNSIRYTRLLDICPGYIMKSWITYFGTGMLNVFKKLK